MPAFGVLGIDTDQGSQKPLELNASQLPQHSGSSQHILFGVLWQGSPSVSGLLENIGDVHGLGSAEFVGQLGGSAIHFEILQVKGLGGCHGLGMGFKRCDGV